MFLPWIPGNSHMRGHGPSVGTCYILRPDGRRAGRMALGRPKRRERGEGGPHEGPGFVGTARAAGWPEAAQGLLA